MEGLSSRVLGVTAASKMVDALSLFLVFFLFSIVFLYANYYISSAFVCEHFLLHSVISLRKPLRL
jgi:hypothetical protein